MLKRGKGVGPLILKRLERDSVRRLPLDILRDGLRAGTVESGNLTVGPSGDDLLAHQVGVDLLSGFHGMYIGYRTGYCQSLAGEG